LELSLRDLPSKNNEEHKEQKNKKNQNEQKKKKQHHRDKAKQLKEDFRDLGSLPSLEAVLLSRSSSSNQGSGKSVRLLL